MISLVSVGYEGAATIGDVVAAAVILVSIVVVVLLAIRWLVAVFSEEPKGRARAGRRL
jgi:uncharacterized membrane-anchored protein